MRLKQNHRLTNVFTVAKKYLIGCFIDDKHIAPLEIRRFSIEINFVSFAIVDKRFVKCSDRQSLCSTIKHDLHSAENICSNTVHSPSTLKLRVRNEDEYSRNAKRNSLFLISEAKMAKMSFESKELKFIFCLRKIKITG
jgi:hypothetical protein